MPIVGMPDGTQVSFPDDMPSAEIKSLIARKFPNEIRAGEASGWNAQKPTIKSYPENYTDMNREARVQMGEGVDQVKAAVAAQPETPAEKGQAAIDFAKGVGKTALGGIGYVASPLNAAYRSVIGQPVEAATGIPKEYTEFAAQLATPGLGLTKMPSFTRAAPKAVAPTVEELKTAASAGYKAPEVAALEIKPTALSDFSKQLQASLNAEGIDAELAKPLFRILSRLENAPPSAFVTGQNLETLRRTLGEAAASINPTKRKAAMIAKNALEDFGPSLKQSDVIAGDAGKAAETIGEANANYSAAKRAELLDQKQLRAELRAAAANSGMNVSNTMRQRLADVLLNPKEHRGWSEAELAHAERIVRGSKLENAVRYLGNILGGGGGMGALLTTEAGINKLGGVGALLAVPGAALKSLSNAMTMREIGKLSEALRSRAPLAQQMQGPIEDWGKAVIAFDEGQNARTAAGVTLAARNLSNNLKDAGVTISPPELLKSLQGPMKSAADEEQQ